MRERAHALVRHSVGETAVVAPVPWLPPVGTPRLRPPWGRPPLKELDAPIEVFHPRYPLVPKLLRAVHPLLLQLGAEATVRRLAQNVGLIDSHYLYPDGVAAARIGKRLGLPVVLTARGSDVNVLAASPIHRAWIRHALMQAAAVVTVSPDLRVRLARTTGIPEQLIEVAPNGVDRSRFYPRDQLVERRALGLPLDEPILLSIGRLASGKRFDLLVTALRRLEPSKRPLLVVVGDGPDRFSLERLARAVGVGDRVRFVGEQPHATMPSWHGAADWLALASDHEGYPNVLLEAIASERPALASGVGSVPEIVTPEVGIIVNENSPEAFAAAIERIAATRFDPAAFERQASLHCWNVAAERIKVIFDRVAAGERTTGR